MTRSHAFALSSDWLIAFSASVVIGHSNYFGFNFTTLKEKPLYTVLKKMLKDMVRLNAYNTDIMPKGQLHKTLIMSDVTPNV